jgi:hypothetical protein
MIASQGPSPPSPPLPPALPPTPPGSPPRQPPPAAPSPCDLEAMVTDASGERSCGARIEWLKSNDGLNDADARGQVAQDFPTVCGHCSSHPPPAAPPLLPDLPPSPPNLPPPAPPMCTPLPNGVLAPLRETAPATVRLTVWLPQTLTVTLDDPILQPIAGLLYEPACVAQRWQTSEARAVASVGGEGLPTVHGLDVTKLVSFVVLNGSVAAVAGSTVSALTPGLTAVVVADAFQSAGALLRVDIEPVTVTGIISLLVNEAA